MEQHRSYSAVGRPVIITDYEQRILGLTSHGGGRRNRGRLWTLEALAHPRPRGCGDVAVRKRVAIKIITNTIVLMAF